MNEQQSSFDKLKDDVHYLIVAHCKHKDMSMYDRALKQFQKDIDFDYGQLEEMSYNERFAFLIGFEKSLLTIEKLNVLNEQSENEKSEITYDKAIYDILCTLPAGTTWITREGIEEIVIRIKKRVLLEEVGNDEK